MQKKERFLQNKQTRFFQNKRGISEVITTLLIILLVIAAVIIVWQVVMPLVKKTAGEVTVGCVTLNMEITNAVCDGSNNTADVTVKRNSGGESVNIKKLIFIFSDGTDSVTKDGTGELPGVLETKTHEDVDFGNEITPTSVAVAPVIDTDGGEKTCDPLATKAISC